MRFYDRQNELKALQKVQERTKDASHLSVITGRRRIGKTRLIQHFCASYPSLYLFVSKKSEEILCQEFMDYIEEILKIKTYGKIIHLIDIFRLLFEHGKKNSLIVVIDEFQELLQINPSFFSDFQNLWDSQKDESHLHIIVSGSVYSLMRKLFLDYQQPLYGRADLILNLKPFPISTVKEVLVDFEVFSAENLLAVYILTGGIPRYLEILHDYDALEKDEAISYVFSEYSVFADEGKNLLIEEFGRDYGVYFSILELISTGKNSRTELESIMQASIGGYLDRLENDYSLITQFRPFNAKKGSRSVKYKLNEPFMAFWFAFFYKYRSAVESNNLSYVKQRFLQDYSQFAGYWLERLYQDAFRQSGKYNLVGSYWESGFQNEIDLVAINDDKQTITLVEIKLNKKNIRKEQLVQKSARLIQQYPSYTIDYQYLGLSDLKSIGDA